MHDMLLESNASGTLQVEKKLADLKMEIVALEKLNRFLERKVLEMTEIQESPSLWLKIEDRETIMGIVSSYADPQKKAILDAVTAKPMNILGIIERTNLPQTTAYRKINEMINGKLIKSTGLFLNKDNKRVHTYTSTIKYMRIYFEGNDILMFLVLDSGTVDFADKATPTPISEN
jgi:hypothetical protein